MSKLLTLFLSPILSVVILCCAPLPVNAQISLHVPSVTSTSILMSLFSFSGSRPHNLGVNAGQFAPCPNTPNCVSSQSIDPEHNIAPLSYRTSPEQAFQNLKTAIQNTERVKVITETENYLHAEFKSWLMGFVDDVEFYLNKDLNAIEVRSASRLGESDLGVNRQRIETLRTMMQNMET